VERIWCVRRDEILLRRIPDDAARMRGLHELPTAAQAGVPASALTPARLLATHRRAITRFQITERIFRVDEPTVLPPAGRVAWVSLAQLGSITLSGPHRRWVGNLLQASGGSDKANR
jgi:A/G-specific adenine glycosylase